MRIFVLCHDLDWEFSARLTVALFQHGLTAQLTYADNKDTWISENLYDVAALIVVLRSEFITTDHLMGMLELADESNILILPIIRAPIDISMWPVSIAFGNMIDFTDHDARYFDAKIADFANVLKLTFPSLNTTSPSQLEIHISKLLLTVTGYISDFSQSPTYQFIENIRFETRNGNSQVEAKLENLGSVLNHYPRVIIKSINIHCQTLVSHIVHHAVNRYSTDPIYSPIPVTLDIGSNEIGEDLFKQSMSFSKSVFKDLSEGKILLIVHGLENAKDKIDAFFEFLDTKIDLTSPSLQIIIVAREIKCSVPFTVAIADQTEITISDLNAFSSHHVNQVPSSFLNIIKESDTLRSFRYFIFNPLLLTHVLTSKIDIVEFSIKNCYSKLVQYLWQVGCQINNDHESKLEMALLGLTKLGALLTNQGRTEFHFDDAAKLLGSKFMLQTVIDSALLKQNGNTVYFSELFLQDYFATLALKQFGFPSKLPSIKLDAMNERAKHFWDRSLILLTHLTEDNQKLLEKLIELDPLLALDAVNSGCQITQSIYERIIEKNLLLLRQLGDFRVAFAKRLQSIDEQTAKAVLLETMREGSWELRTASLQILNEIKIVPLPGVYSIVNTFDDHDNSVTYALRRIGSDSTVTLLKLLRHDDPLIRQRTAWLLGKLNDKVASPALIEKLKDISPDVILEALNSIATLNDLQTLMPLARISKNASRKVRKAIRDTLLKMLRANPEKFTQETQKLDVRSRYTIVLLVCNSIEQPILDFALTFSHDPNPEVRIAAIQSFLYSGDVKVINRLGECLNDTERSSVRKSTVSEIAAKILAASGLIQVPRKDNDTKVDSITNDKRKSSEIVKSRLINAKTPKRNIATNDKDNDVKDEHDQVTPQEINMGKATEDDLRITSILNQMREQGWNTSNDAAKQLRDYAKQLHGKASTRIVNQVIETLNDEDWVMRWSGVETLGWIGNIHVVPHLIQRLVDVNWKIRVAAIRALAEIKDDSAIGAISELMTDKHSVVREAAAEALGNLGSEKTIPALEKASNDPEEFVRLAAVESLGRIKDELAITSLLSSLKDDSDHVRWAAANALVGISTPQISSILAQSLNDNGGPYWEQKRICDVIADILDQFNTNEAKSAMALWRKNQAQSSS